MLSERCWPLHRCPSGVNAKLCFMLSGSVPTRHLFAGKLDCVCATQMGSKWSCNAPSSHAAPAPGPFRSGTEHYAALRSRGKDHARGPLMVTLAATETTSWLQARIRMRHPRLACKHSVVLH